MVCYCIVLVHAWWLVAYVQREGMVRELRLASFYRCCACGRNVTVVVRLRCRPTMVIGVSFSICVGAVVGEKFFGDAAIAVNGGLFTYYAHSGWMLVTIQFFFLIFKAYYPRLTSKLRQ